MSYNSKRSISHLVVIIILIVAYIYYVTSIRTPDENDLKGWATLVLCFIGISVVSLIVTQVIFHIGYAMGVATKETDKSDENINSIVSNAMVEDEMDKLIHMKSIKIGYLCATLGFVSSLISLSLGFSMIAMIHIVLLGFVLGIIIEECFNIYHYEIGIHHG